MWEKDFNRRAHKEFSRRNRIRKSMEETEKNGN